MSGLLLSRVEAAAHLGLAQRTFDRHVRADLHPLRKGASVFFSVVDLEAWIDAHKQNGHVYAVEAIDLGLVKIGWTTGALDERVSGIQGMSPVPVRLLASRRACASDERKLHAHFSHLRKHREWFELTTELRAHLLKSRWV